MNSEKTCTKCGLTKSVDEFSKNSRNKTDGRQPKCKSCNSAYRMENIERINEYDRNRRELLPQRKEQDRRYREKNKEKMKAFLRDYYLKNIDSIKDRQRKYVERNKSWIYARQNAYLKANRPLANKINKERKLKINLAKPKWANDSKMILFYEKAKELTNATGIPYEVDHIVPIKSKIVCGLHCEANLQVIPAIDNNKKGNRYWPDMPEPIYSESFSIFRSIDKPQMAFST